VSRRAGILALTVVVVSLQLNGTLAMDQKPFPDGSGEKKMSGEELGFSRCKVIVERYLHHAQANPKSISYSASAVWGNIIRMTYIQKDESGESSEISFMCWQRPGQEVVESRIDTRPQ